MRSKIKMKLLCGVMLILTLLFFTGCGEKATAESIMEQVSANMEKLESAKIKQRYEIKVNVSGESDGVNMDMDFEIAMDIEAKMTMDPKTAHLTGTMAMNATGMNMETTTEAYQVEEDGTLVEYEFDSNTESWTRSEVDSDSIGSMTGFGQFSDLGYTLADKTEDVNGTEAYVLSATVKGKDLESIFDNYASSAEDGMFSEDAYTDSIEAELTLYVDKTEMLPLKVTLDLGDTASSLLSSILGDGAELDSAELNKFYVTVEYSEINAVDPVKVPQDVKDAAVENVSGFIEEDSESVSEGDNETDYSVENDEIEPNENGEYILHTEDQKASMTVSVLEGFTYSYSSAAYGGYVSFNDNNTIDINYSIYSGITKEYLVENLEYTYGWMSDESEESYQNVVLHDMQTVTVGSKEVSYHKLTYDYVSAGESNPCVEYLIWVMEGDIGYTAQIEVFGDDSIDDSIVTTVFSAIKFN